MMAVMAARPNPRNRFIDYLPPSAIFLERISAGTNAENALWFPEKSRPHVFLCGACHFFTARLRNQTVRPEVYAAIYRALHKRGARRVLLRANGPVKNRSVLGWMRPGRI
jgi:hypothetical protein